VPSAITQKLLTGCFPIASRSALNPLTNVLAICYNRGVVDNKAGSSGVSSTDPTPNPTGGQTTGRAANILAHQRQFDKPLGAAKSGLPAGAPAGRPLAL